MRNSEDMEDNTKQQISSGGEPHFISNESQFVETFECDTISHAIEGEYSMSMLSECEHIHNMTSQPDGQLPIIYLPEVVLVNIMEYLSLKDRYHLSVTCKLFYSLFSHPQLWQVAHISLFTQDNYQGRASAKWRLKSIMQTTMAEIVHRFSHLFQHLSLEMHRHVQPFDDTCRRMLEHLNKDCRLETLSLRLGALASNDEYMQRASSRSNNFSDLPLVVGLIKKAVRLKKLNIISWPLHAEAEGKNEIFQTLLENEKLTRLEYLNIFYVDAKSESWTERNPRLPSLETTFELVSHFRNLTHLALRSPMLSNEIVMELASKKRSKLCLFQILIVYARDCEYMDGYKVPDISSEAWHAIKMSSPELKVEFLALTRIPTDQMNLMLKPEVPLSSFSILTYGRCDRELIENLVEKYRRSLEKFVCLCDCTECDEALINLAKSCTQLQQIIYHGSVCHETVIQMAEIIQSKGHMFTCLELKEKNIQTNATSEEGDVVVARDEDGGDYYLVGLRSWHQDEDARRHLLDIMNEKVSHALGYRWQPMA